MSVEVNGKEGVREVEEGKGKEVDDGSFFPLLT